MSTKITIKNISIYGYHGVLANEKELGGKYQVDIVFWYDSQKAAKNDDIKLAVDYSEIINVTVDIVKNKRFNLIESLAKYIIDELLTKFEAIDKISLSLRKYYIPISQNIEYVEVEETKSRL